MDSSFSTNGSIISWHWDFGDNSTDTVQNPCHTYPPPNPLIIQPDYLTTLVVVNASGDRDTVASYVGGAAPPILGFTSSVNGNTISFSDISSDHISSWNWSFGDGNTSIVENPSNTYTANGTYQVCMRVSGSSCQDSICQSVTITTVGINDLHEALSINIFPNPTSGNLFLDFGNKNFGNAEIIFTDVVGQTLMAENKFALGKYDYDVSRFSNGIYFVRINTEAGSMTKKIIINK